MDNDITLRSPSRKDQQSRLPHWARTSTHPAKKIWGHPRINTEETSKLGDLEWLPMLDAWYAHIAHDEFEKPCAVLDESEW